MSGFLILLIAYSGVLVAVGLALSRYVKTAGDFFVAGRRLGAGLLFTTFLAANIGAGSTVGAAGLAYRNGLSAWWWVGSAGIGCVILALAVGPRIYRIAREHNFYTLGDYLEYRYSRAVRAVVAVALWFGSLVILAGQLIAIAWILNVVAGISKPIGCVLGGAVVTMYFTAGGLFSSVWVNLVQLVVKMTGFMIATPWALSVLGGWNAVRTRAALTSGTALPEDTFFSMTGMGAAGILGLAVILIPSFIVSPGLIQKLYGARDARAVRVGIGIQAIALLLYSFLPVVLGIVALAAFPGLTNRELALPMVLRELLPTWLGALLLAAVFSAEVSSADAVLFMLSTSVAKDLYKTFLRPEASEASLLRATRIAAVIAGIAGTLAAIVLPTVIDALTIFYSLLAVLLFVPLLAGLYSSRPTAGAALACMTVSIAVAATACATTGGKGWGMLNPFAAGILAGAVVMGAMAEVGRQTSDR